MIKSAYIHVPFCKTICSYCDFCKFYYDKTKIIPYLDALRDEIKKDYQGEILDTIYIGGGTPNSLDNNELIYLLEIVNDLKKNKNYEYTFECNVEFIDREQLLILKKYGVNRLSIGVQTFNNSILKIINRKHTEQEVIDKIKLCKEVGFNNINIDLMYALPTETIDILKHDLETFLSLDITHLSAYSLILENHTIFSIKKIDPIDEDLEFEMYKLIKDTLQNHGYKHYEISNYAKEGYESVHNLTYWNNEEYYGFGLNSSAYINNVRKTNTSILKNYLNGKYTYSKEDIDRNLKLEYEFILGFRKINGINKQAFLKKYNININCMKIVKELIDENKLIDDGTNIYINDKYLYTQNDILVRFVGEDYEE